MIGLTTLWLPILVSAIAVFFASSLVHMMLPWHKSDYGKLPNEDAVRTALRPFALPPGDYMVPRPSAPSDMRSPEFADKVKAGPVMVVTVMRNEMMGMGRNLSLWFVYCLVISAFAAHIGWSLGRDAGNMLVFHVIALTSLLGYSGALWQMSIWYRRKWSTTLKATVDGLIYAMITGGIFAWLWPR